MRSILVGGELIFVWRRRARSIRRASPEAESPTIDSEPAATDGEPE
jgi:hypothetical protein